MRFFFYEGITKMFSCFGGSFVKKTVSRTNDLLYRDGHQKLDLDEAPGLLGTNSGLSTGESHPEAMHTKLTEPGKS